LSAIMEWRTMTMFSFKRTSWASWKISLFAQSISVGRSLLCAEMYCMQCHGTTLLGNLRGLNTSSIGFDATSKDRQISSLSSLGRPRSRELDCDCDMLLFDGASEMCCWSFLEKNYFQTLQALFQANLVLWNSFD
jgi:hypothetical protein